jgi:hypothetical protein
VTRRRQVEQALIDERSILELDLERVVQTVTDATTRMCGAKFGAFFYNIIDDRGECYRLYTLSGAPHPEPPAPTTPENGEQRLASVARLRSRLGYGVPRGPAVRTRRASPGSTIDVAVVLRTQLSAGRVAQGGHPYSPH